MGSAWKAGLVVVFTLLLGWLILWPRPAFGISVAAESPGLATDSVLRTGAVLFDQHCAGCHVNGGNVIRRGKTLRMAALRRAGLTDSAAVARVAAMGQGQMGGYEAVLGSGGAEAVGAWVWQQAQADWPKQQSARAKAQ